MRAKFRGGDAYAYAYTRARTAMLPDMKQTASAQPFANDGLCSSLGTAYAPYDNQQHARTIVGNVEAVFWHSVAGWLCVRGYQSSHIVLQLRARNASNTLLGTSRPTIRRTDAARAHRGRCEGSRQQGFEIPVHPATHAGTRIRVDIFLRRPESCTSRLQIGPCCTIFGPGDFAMTGGNFASGAQPVIPRRIPTQPDVSMPSCSELCRSHCAPPSCRRLGCAPPSHTYYPTLTQQWRPRFPLNQSEPQTLADSVVVSQGWSALATGTGTKIFMKKNRVLKVFLGSPVTQSEQYSPFATEVAILSHLAKHSGSSKWRASGFSFPTLYRSYNGTYTGQRASFLEMSHCGEQNFSLALSMLPSAQQVLAVVQHLLNALEALHLKGVEHRDIDASNVRVDADGTVCIIDFGMAVSEAVPARGRTPLMFSRHPPPDRFLCGYDDIYSTGTMLKHALSKSPHAHSTGARALQNLIFHTTRPACAARLRDFSRLRAMLDQFGLVEDPAPPCFAANTFVASAPRVERAGTPGCFSVRGYQRFVACRNGSFATDDTYLAARLAALTWLPWHGLSVLELGASFGFYSLAALRAGARGACLVEADARVRYASRTLAHHLELPVRPRTDAQSLYWLGPCPCPCPPPCPYPCPCPCPCPCPHACQCPCPCVYTCACPLASR